MKFLCISCDQQMQFAERQEPGDGTFAASFRCPQCGHQVALLANPMETQLVGSLGIRIGGRTLDAQPLEQVRTTVQGSEAAFLDSEQGARSREQKASTIWSPDAQERLARVPGFVRGMVKRIYADYAAERGIAEITPDVMDRARGELGLEGM